MKTKKDSAKQEDKGKPGFKDKEKPEVKETACNFKHKSGFYLVKTPVSLKLF